MRREAQTTRAAVADDAGVLKGKAPAEKNEAAALRGERDDVRKSKAPAEKNEAIAEKTLRLPATPAELAGLRAGDAVRLYGSIYTMRDAGHLRALEHLQATGELPYNLSGQALFYAGPTEPVAGLVGPATSRSEPAVSSAKSAAGPPGLATSRSDRAVCFVESAAAPPGPMANSPEPATSQFESAVNSAEPATVLAGPATNFPNLAAGSANSSNPVANSPKAATGRPFGAIGPTTASRMDFATPALLRAGITVTLGKGPRSPQTRAACVETGAVYLAAVGGAAALLAGYVTDAELVAWPDLGTEALRRLTLNGLPAFVAIDARGGDLYAQREAL